MIKINISTKLAYTILALLGLIIITLIGVKVYAYTYTTAIPSPGHGADKVWIDMLGPNPDNGEQTLQDAISRGQLRNMPRVSSYPGVYATWTNIGIHDVCFIKQIFLDDDDDDADCMASGTPGGTWYSYERRMNGYCTIICLDWYPLNS